MKKLACLGITITMLCSLTGCGGGSGSSGVIAAKPLTQKTAVVAFSVVSTSKLPVRINTFKITAYLPAGVTVPTLNTDPDQISASALSPGFAVTSALQNNYVILGRYSSSARKVTIALQDTSPTQGGFSPGEIAILTCNVQSGNTLTANDFTSQPPIGLNADGFDSSSKTLVDLSGSLRPFLKVYFGY